MKKIIILSIALMFLNDIAVSQEADYSGCRFLKRIEYNVIVPGGTEEDNMYNLESKSTIDRILFGTKNSYVEFVFRGAAEGLEGISGFRIVKNSQTGSFGIEIMQMPDANYIYYNIEKKLSPKEKQIDLPYELLVSVSPDVRGEIKKHNEEVNLLRFKNDLYDPYKPKSETYSISKELAEKLYDKLTSIIYNFKSEGIPMMGTGGNEVTLRCVVGNELWTLIARQPEKRIRQLTDVCLQIVKDSSKSEIDASKYIKLLDEIKL